MIEYDGNTPRKIIIPVSGSEELLQYQRSLLSLLKIPISKITPQQKKDINVIFQLLKHLESKKNLGQLIEFATFGPDAIKLFQELHDGKYPAASA